MNNNNDDTTNNINNQINNVETVPGKRYNFWLNDPSVLYADSNYIKFIPTPEMSRIEQLNAVTRFCVYSIILLFLFNKDNVWFYIPIVILIFIIFLYYIYQFDPKGKEKELYRERLKTIEGFGTEITSDVTPGSEKEYELESGYYDFTGNLKLGKDYDSQKRNFNKINYSLNDLLEYQNATCRRPTKDNPFMNPPVTDFNDGNKPVACNADDEDIKQEMEDNFNDGIYRDVQDLFNIKNSQRQFYTVPTVSIPNDQTAFAEWLYKIPDTCKEDQEQCLGYEDLRYKR